MTAGDLFSKSKRVVIKIGSSLLIDSSGQLSSSKVRRLVKFVAKLKEEGREVAVVSSGAVAASWNISKTITGLSNSENKPNKPVSLPKKQARSSIGQIYLMEKYRRSFARLGYQVGQILISKFSINHRASYLNARNTIHELWRMGAIPIINENDPLSTEEFRFGENDILGALACGLVDADFYLILSHIDGVYKDFTNTQNGKIGELYETITDLSTKFLNGFAKGTSTHGSGGIMAKLEAARLAAKFGVPTLIKNGNKENLHQQIIGGDRGTLIHLNNTEKVVNAKKRWLLSHGSPKGTIRIDEGAALAIAQGKSLLPGGVIEVKKNWEEGDVCDLVDLQNHVIARGLCNYSNRDLILIQGHKSRAIAGILKCPSHAEVVHRDNLVLLNSFEESQTNK